MLVGSMGEGWNNPLDRHSYRAITVSYENHFAYLSVMMTSCWITHADHLEMQPPALHSLFPTEVEHPTGL